MLQLPQKLRHQLNRIWDKLVSKPSRNRQQVKLQNFLARTVKPNQRTRAMLLERFRAIHGQSNGACYYAADREMKKLRQRVAV